MIKNTLTISITNCQQHPTHRSLLFKAIFLFMIVNSFSLSNSFNQKITKKTFVIRFRITNTFDLQVTKVDHLKVHVNRDNENIPFFQILNVKQFFNSFSKKTFRKLKIFFHFGHHSLDKACHWADLIK